MASDTTDYTARLQRLDDLAEQRRDLSEFQAVFDLGTRAARFVVAPRDPNLVTRRSLIASVSTETFLGKAVDHDRNVLEFGSELDTAVDFVAMMRSHALSLGIPAANQRAVATASFRDISNRDAVLDAFSERAGIRPEILSEGYEGRLALLSAWVNFRNRRRIREGDYILLIDQGGGSCEITFAQVKGKGFPAASEIESISLTLGTLRLADDAILPNAPRDKRVHAKAQLSRVADRTYNALRVLLPFGKPLSGHRIHAFAMGTAVTKMAHGNVWQINGTVFTEQRLRKRLGQLRRDYRDKPYAPEQFSNDYAQLYGLPVYLAVMKMFRLRTITLCGFGLRFGALYERAFGLDWSDEAAAGK